MPPIQGFVGQAYVSIAKNVAAQSLKNWYPQSVEATGEISRVQYMPTPGLASGWNLSASPMRALFAQDGRAFGVSGRTLYELKSDRTAVGRGTLTLADTNPASIFSNGVAGGQLFIVSGGKADIFTLATNVLAPVTAAGYPTDTPMGAYLDSYFLTSQGSSAQLNISGSLNGSTWSALDFAVRTDQSDNIVGIVQTNRYVWLIGSATSEPWYNSGATFPFQAVPQAVVPIGCCAPASICSLNTHTGASIACWLHQTARGAGVFVAATQYQPQRISTFAIEQEWETYPTFTDCVSYGYSDRGHDFVVLTFPSGNTTWAYDFTENAWHKRTWWNQQSGSDDRHRGICHCYAFGQHLIGDWQNGVVWVMDESVTTDGDQPIVRERISPHANDQLKTLFFSNFQLDMHGGIGNGNDPGSAPTISLNWSDDGGYTFNDTAIQMPVGAIGNYGTRCRAAGSLGSGRNRVWRIRSSDPVPFRGIQQAYVDVVEGAF